MFAALAGVMALACATKVQGPGAAGEGAVRAGSMAGASPLVAAVTTVTLAGARCTAGTCQCREPGGDNVETPPPGDGSKRFEIRMSSSGGTASLDLTHLGTVATPSSSAATESCFYIDVPTGSTHEASFVAKESAPGRGVAPRLRIAEYSPKGNHWYDIVAISCEGTRGACDRRAAEAWAAAARQRKRGRIDPCGSTVVTKLAWETSGGQAEREGGLFVDFTARFLMDVKSFATQFAPGSTECLPK